MTKIKDKERRGLDNIGSTIFSKNENLAMVVPPLGYKKTTQLGETIL